MPGVKHESNVTVHANGGVFPTPHRNVARRFINRRIRGIVDLSIASMTLGVLIGLSANIYGTYIINAHVCEALSHAIVLKENLLKGYYLTGNWPSEDPGIFDYSDDSRAIKNVDYEQGGFTFLIQKGDSSYQLSFRAALSDDSLRSPILWLCGYAEVPPGYRTVAINKTNIPIMYLPSVCRG